MGSIAVQAHYNEKKSEEKPPLHLKEDQKAHLQIPIQPLVLTATLWGTCSTSTPRQPSSVLWVPKKTFHFASKGKQQICFPIALYSLNASSELSLCGYDTPHLKAHNRQKHPASLFQTYT